MRLRRKIRRPKYNVQKRGFTKFGNISLGRYVVALSIGWARSFRSRLSIGSPSLIERRGIARAHDLRNGHLSASRARVPMALGGNKKSTFLVTVHRNARPLNLGGSVSASTSDYIGRGNTDLAADSEPRPEAVLVGTARMCELVL
jgi:hypothetical protein